MKHLELTVLAVLLICLGAVIGVKWSSTDLEIYTSDNIYYIDGFTVTNEVDDSVKRFTNKSELKDYISDISAKEN